MVTRTTPRTKQSMGMKSKKVKQHSLTKKSKGTRKSKLYIERNIPNSNEQLNIIQPTLKTLSNRTKKLNTGRPQLKGSGLKLKLPKIFKRTKKKKDKLPGMPTNNIPHIPPKPSQNPVHNQSRPQLRANTRQKVPKSTSEDPIYATVVPRTMPTNKPLRLGNTPYATIGNNPQPEHVYAEVGNNLQPEHVYEEVSNLPNAMTSEGSMYEEVGQIIESNPLVNKRVLHTKGTMTSEEAATYAQPSHPNMTNEAAATYAQPTPPNMPSEEAATYAQPNPPHEHTNFRPQFPLPITTKPNNHRRKGVYPKKTSLIAYPEDPTKLTYMHYLTNQEEENPNRKIIKKINTLNI